MTPKQETRKQVIEFTMLSTGCSRGMAEMVTGTGACLAWENIKQENGLPPETKPRHYFAAKKYVEDRCEEVKEKR